MDLILGEEVAKNPPTQSNYEKKNEYIFQKKSLILFFFFFCVGLYTMGEEGDGWMYNKLCLNGLTLLKKERKRRRK
jgi:hypothetical protein